MNIACGYHGSQVIVKFVNVSSVEVASTGLQLCLEVVLVLVV